MIPRPAGWKAGGAPPWADSGRGDGGITVPLAHVRAAVAAAGGVSPEPGPGAAVHGEVGVPAAPVSAVLVPLFEEAGETRVVLTRRATWLRAHAGQVAFPGGRVEPGETLSEAALREASEEIGLDPAEVEVIGGLSCLWTAVRPGAPIHPVVGVLARRAALSPSRHEVERIFDVELRRLMDEGVFHEERWELAGVERSIFFFEAEGETVWGATAAVLHELLTLLDAGRKGSARPRG